MHVPRPLFDVRRFVFVLQYNFKRPLTLTLTINRGLQSGNIVLKLVKDKRKHHGAVDKRFSEHQFCKSDTITFVV